MNNILILLLVIILQSCIGKDHNNSPSKVIANEEDTYTKEKMQKQENKIDTLKLSGNIDSVEIFCLMFGKYTDKSFTLYFSNTNFEIKIVDFHNEADEIEICSSEIHNHLINYINQFYIDKEEEIVLEKNEDEPMETDHPSIRAQGFKDGKKIFDKKNKIEYHVDYNPKFREFYEFLNNLIEDR